MKKTEPVISKRSSPGKRANTRNSQETLLIPLAILDMIPKVGRISTREIHDRLLAIGFERDMRSIQRQLEVLSTQFPIERDDSSKPFGYKWKAHAKGISIPGLSLHESLLLNMAEKYLQSLLPPGIKRSMEGFFSQARYNLATKDNEALERRWMDKVRVVSTSVPLLPPQIIEGVLETISKALYFDTWLELDYSNASGQRKQHRVMPLGLAQQGPRLLLVVRFDGYDDERSIAVSRIHKAVDTELPFPKVKDFDLAKYDAAGGFGYGQGKSIQLKFRIDRGIGQFLTESPLSADQSHTVLGKQLEITATVTKTEHLIWWLRGFGRLVEVLAPASLVAEVSR